MSDEQISKLRALTLRWEQEADRREELAKNAGDEEFYLANTNISETLGACAADLRGVVGEGE